MKTDAIKLELIEWLTGLDNEGLLKSLLQYKQTTQEKDWFDTLTPEQLSRVEQGIEDYKKGRTVKSKDVWKKYGRKG